MLLLSATLVTAFYHPRVECRMNLMTQAALYGEWNYVSCSRIPSIRHCTRGDRANILTFKWLLCFTDLLQSGVANIWTIYICISNWGLPRAFVIFEIVSSDLFKGYELIWANFLKQFGGLGESLFQKKCFVNRSKIAHPNFGYITLMEK